MTELSRRLVPDELWALVRPLIPQHRWVIERAIAWPVGYRRLTIRYERHANHYCALLTLAATLTCF